MQRNLPGTLFVSGLLLGGVFGAFAFFISGSLDLRLGVGIVIGCSLFLSGIGWLVGKLVLERINLGYTTISKTHLPNNNMKSDLDSLAILLKRVNANGDVNDPNTPRPLVSLEDFFEGNNDFGSIGYNFYPDQPAPSEFYKIFRSIASKPSVHDVRVEIQDQIEPEDWPSTDTIWIITSTEIEELDAWLGERFRGDDYIVGFPDNHLIEDYEVPQGLQAIGVWYD